MGQEQDFSLLSGPELLDAYNSMAGVANRRPRTARFSSRAEGIRRCEELSRLVPMVALKGESPDQRRETEDRIIKMLADSNPRRVGTFAYRAFEAMMQSQTIGGYLALFADGQERLDAMQWLNKSRQQGYLRLLSPEDVVEEVGG